MSNRGKQKVFPVVHIHVQLLITQLEHSNNRSNFMKSRCALQALPVRYCSKIEARTHAVMAIQKWKYNKYGAMLTYDCIYEIERVLCEHDAPVKSPENIPN